MTVQIRAKKRETFEDIFKRINTRLSDNEFSEYLRQSDLLPILLDALELSDELVPNEKLKIVRRALGHIKETGLDIGLFLSKITELQTAILATSPKLFYLTALISLNSSGVSEILLRRKINKTNFIISRTFPPKLEFEPFEGNGFPKIGHHESPHFSKIYGFKKARSLHQAAIAMMDDLDYWLSCLNFVQHYGRRSISGTPSHPTRKIGTGRFFIIHDSKGIVQKDHWWFETNYFQPIFMTNIDSKGDRNWIAQTDKLIHSIGNLQYGNVIRQALRQINAALADNDSYSSLAKFWSALEIITGSTQGEANQTIKRASFFSTRPEERRIVLKYISEVRNRYIHTGNRDGFIETLTDNLRNYIENLIAILGSDQFLDLSFSELVEIMDQPSNIKLLSRRRDVISRAIEIISSD